MLIAERQSAWAQLKLLQIEYQRASGELAAQEQAA
jgi:hypothetical protein